MTASASTPADIVNLALRRIGYKLHVGSLFDGSEASSQALDIYAQTRDELLRNGNWSFAERMAALTVLKTAPAGGYFPPTVWSDAYPPQPWAYEYDYPSDCLKVRALRETSLFLFNPDPQPILFDTANDTVASETEKVLATIAVNSPGTGVYAPADIIQLSGGTALSPARVTVASTKVVSATIAAAGTGGTPGAATVTGTTGTGTKFQASVTISGGGAVSTVNSISTAGAYTANPTDPTQEPVTGGGLSGAKLNVKMGVLTVGITTPGIFTTTSATFTQAGTDGDGTGATFSSATFAPLTRYQRVILANIAGALCIYTGRVTNPSDWDVTFTEAFAAQLAERLAPVLMGLEAAKLAVPLAARDKQTADMSQG